MKDSEAQRDSLASYYDRNIEEMKNMMDLYYEQKSTVRKTCGCSEDEEKNLLRNKTEL